MTNCKLVLIPLPVKQPPLYESSVSAFNCQHHFLVGFPQYLTLTRFDIAFSVNKLCQYFHSPSSTHTQLLKCVLHYIKGTLRHGISINYGLLNITTYSDVDWVGNSINRHSITGFCIFLGHTLIS